MADISDILENIRDNDSAREFTFKKAVSRSYYANTPAGQDLFNVDLYESHAPGAPTGAAAPASPLVPGQSYTVKQLQLANLYKPAFEDNKNAGKGIRLTVAGGLMALILGAGSCVMENDNAPHVYGYGRHVSTTSAKDVFKGMAVVSGGIAALAAAYAAMKKK
jgi:hypothetical protein